MHYFGIVSADDQITGHEGALKLYRDRSKADKELLLVNMKASASERYFIASFKLKHSMTYGKVVI